MTGMRSSSARRKHRPGTFIRIKLPDGTYAYGRELAAPYTAFYALRTKEPSDNLDEIEKQPVLFKVAVREKGTEAWDAIGHRELTGDVAKPVVQIHQEIGAYRKCVIFDSDGNERAARPEESVRLERDVVWEPHGIANRLLDRFEA